MTTKVLKPDEAAIRRYWSCKALVSSPVAGEANAAMQQISRIAGKFYMTTMQFEICYPDPSAPKPATPRVQQAKPQPAQQPKPQPKPQQQPKSPFANKVNEAKQRTVLISALKDQKRNLEALLEERKQARIQLRKSNKKIQEDYTQSLQTIATLRRRIEAENAKIRKQEKRFEANNRSINLSKDSDIGVKNTLKQINDQLNALSVKKAFNGLFDSIFK